MSLRHHVPADVEPQSVAELSADCASLTALYPDHPLPPPGHWHAHQVLIPDDARKLTEGMSDYGGMSEYAH
jgi:hypothetical protein